MILSRNKPYFIKNSERVILVLNSDVFIEGVLIAESYCGRLVDYLLDERFDIAMDDRIYLEYSAKLNNKKLGLEKKSIDCLLKFLKENGKFVTAEKLRMPDHLNSICPRFLKFVEVGKSSKSDAIVVLDTGVFKPAYPNLFTSIMTAEEVFEKLL